MLRALLRQELAGHSAMLGFAAQSYDAAEFPALVEKYDKLAWRILSKPGGATMKPDEYYTLYG